MANFKRKVPKAQLHLISCVLTLLSLVPKEIYWVAILLVNMFNGFESLIKSYYNLTQLPFTFGFSMSLVFRPIIEIADPSPALLLLKMQFLIFEVEKLYSKY